MLIRRNGEETWQSPEVTAYDNEAALQRLLQSSPGLLPGGNDRPMAIVTELKIANDAWADLVGVDVDGEITIVECKLRKNPEIRRQAMGQLLAYAAGLWKLSYEAFDRAFAASAKAGGSVVDKVAQAVQQDGADSAEPWDEESFRSTVAANLQSGRFRLVLAVDQITDELKRTILYLNEHTGAEVQVLGLELGYVRHADVEILLPATYGEESVVIKTPRTVWDEAILFSELAKRCTPAGVQAVQTLYQFALAHGFRPSWGHGAEPKVNLNVRNAAGRILCSWSCYISQNRPGFDVNFAYMREQRTREDLTRFANRLREISGVTERLAGLEEARVDFNKRPSLPIDQILTQAGAVEKIETALADMMQVG